MGVEPPAQFLVGDSVPLDGDSSNARAVRTPVGQVVPVEKGATSFTETWEPGLYSVEATGAGGRVLRRFAVNIDPQESRTVPMSPEILERFGAPLMSPPLVTERLPEHPASIAAAEAEAQQKLWKWVLVGALGVLMLETALAAVTGRRALTSIEGQPEGAS